MIQPGQVYLNGDWLPADEARVSAFDRGFIFGDGVYEMIPVYGDRPFRLQQHLARLNNSLRAIDLANPLNDEQWRAILERLIGQNSPNDQAIYLQVTRGPAPRDHAFPAQVTPTVFAYSKVLKYPEPADLERGGTAITTPDIRWQRCDIKAIALLGNVILRQQAVAQGATEAILIRDGYLTEGAASNIFIVKDGRIMTPEKGELILPGITRDLVVELAKSHGLDCREQAITEPELFEADEVWMTSSTKEVFPIIKIDDHVVGNGKRGPVHEKLFAIYQDYKRDFRAGKVD